MLDQRAHRLSISALEPFTSNFGRVIAGSFSTDGGQSHSCERATCRSPAPSACKISVELAMSETTRG